jgi:methyl-accepting chemotaxis protein
MQSSLSRTGLGVELANEAGEVILEIQQGSRHVVDAISQFNETLQLNRFLQLDTINVGASLLAKAMCQ